MNHRLYACVCHPAPRGGAAPLRLRSLSAVKEPPLLHSNRGAKHTLVLDFSGRTIVGWNGNAAPPELSLDGVAGFSNRELSLIGAVHTNVAAHFAPFDVDVTTEMPAALTPGRVLVAAIGGKGTARGVSIIGGYTQTGLNVVQISPLTGFLLNPDDRGTDEATAQLFWDFLGDVVAHECGHAYGLGHQSNFDAAGKLTQIYGQNWLPNGMEDLQHGWTMGNSYGYSGDGWVRGPGPDNKGQDDLAILTMALGVRPLVVPPAPPAPINIPPWSDYYPLLQERLRAIEARLK